MAQRPQQVDRAAAGAAEPELELVVPQALQIGGLPSSAAEFAQLDATTTAADPNGPGPLTSGYDADFQETVLVSSSGGRGQDARREKPLIRVPCQIEIQGFGEFAALATGNSPRLRLVLVFHFADLERLGLVDPVTGEALLRIGTGSPRPATIGPATSSRQCRPHPGCI